VQPLQAAALVVLEVPSIV